MNLGFLCLVLLAIVASSYGTAVFLSNPTTIRAVQTPTQSGSDNWSNLQEITDSDFNNFAQNEGTAPGVTSIITISFPFPVTKDLGGLAVFLEVQLDQTPSGNAAAAFDLCRWEKNSVLGSDQIPGTETLPITAIKSGNQNITIGSGSDLMGFSTVTSNELNNFKLQVRVAFSGNGQVKANFMRAFTSFATKEVVNTISLSPSSVAGLTGGQSIAVRATGLTNNILNFAPACKFGAAIVVALSFNNTHIVCVAPAQALGGSIPLEISLNSILFTENNVQFTYVAPPPPPPPSGENCGFGCVNGGICVGATCLCSFGFSGVNCQTADCSAVNNCTSPANGACTGPAVCECESGFQGRSCSTPVCIADCSLQGLCVAPFNCSCNPGFGGATCAEFVCDDVLCTLPNQVCSGPNLCTCIPGFGGENCTDIVECPNLNNCNGKGVCISPTQCLCNPEFIGADCSALLNVPPDNRGLIIGLVVGLLAVVVIAVIVILVFIRRRKAKNYKLKVKQPNYADLISSQFLRSVNQNFSTEITSSFRELLLSNGALLTAIFSASKPTDIDHLSQACAYLFDFHSRGPVLLDFLLQKEIHNQLDDITLFRSNSPLTKCFSQFVRLRALPYLWVTLAYVINELKMDVEEVKVDLQKNLHKESQSSILGVSMELDPSRLENDDQIILNKLKMELFCQKVLELIFSSIEDMPPQLIQFLHNVQKTASAKFSDEKGHQAVGSFFFLRMFSPALVAPQVYGLITGSLEDVSLRYLVLVSKTITCIANNTLPGKKETFMEELTNFIMTNQKRLAKFYQKIQGLNDAEAVTSDSLVSLQEENGALNYLFQFTSDNWVTLSESVSGEVKQKMTELLEKPTK